MANNKTSNIYIRIEPEVKKEAEDILSRLGIGASQAVNMFYKQIILHQGMPFDVTIPTNNPKPKVIKTVTQEEKHNSFENPKLIVKQTTYESNINKEVIPTKQEVHVETAKEREDRAIAEIKKKYGL